MREVKRGLQACVCVCVLASSRDWHRHRQIDVCGSGRLAPIFCAMALFSFFLFFFFFLSALLPPFYPGNGQACMARLIAGCGAFFESQSQLHSAHNPCNPALVPMHPCTHYHPLPPIPIAHNPSGPCSPSSKPRSGRLAPKMLQVVLLGL